MCVWIGKNTAVCCLTARKSPRNSSLPLGLAIHILRKMPTKSDDSSVECYVWRAVCVKNIRDISNDNFGPRQRGRGQVGVTDVGVVYFLPRPRPPFLGFFSVAGHLCFSVRVTVSMDLAVCH